MALQSEDLPEPGFAEDGDLGLVVTNLRRALDDPLALFRREAVSTVLQKAGQQVKNLADVLFENVFLWRLHGTVAIRAGNVPEENTNSISIGCVVGPYRRGSLDFRQRLTPKSWIVVGSTEAWAVSFRRSDRRLLNLHFWAHV